MAFDFLAKVPDGDMKQIGFLAVVRAPNGLQQYAMG